MSAAARPEKFEIPKTVLSRTVGSETILLNLETSTYHSLNCVGGRFWALVLEGKDFQEAVAVLHEEYDVEPAQLEADLRELCDELQNLSLLHPAE
jgi:Coenzyme PQQ synthesis protein D (PqqD)